MAAIEHIHAREVFDSRGKPTVEVEVTCRDARPGRAIVPSGASTGRFEAVERRDGDMDRLEGTGVLQAVENVRGEIASAIVGMDAADQAAIDERLCELDGSDDKSRIGANAILGASLAIVDAQAQATGLSRLDRYRELWRTMPPNRNDLARQSEQQRHSGRTAGLGTRPLLPLPMVNMISGGLHAGKNLDFQDFLILPVGATSYREALDWIVTVYHRLGQLLAESGHEAALVGDEGGYGPKLRNNREAIETVIAAIEAAGLRPGTDVSLGLDIASTHFFEDGEYHLSATGGGKMLSDAFIETLLQWIEDYPLISIEDALAEDDWDAWRRLTERVGNRIQLIGDDLFVTNRIRLQRGIQSNVANSILIKLNQIGTVSETFETIRTALDCGYWPVVSARSGETEDTTIADIVVATGAGQIKIGSVARSERLAKYNQLLRLEERLGNDAGYLGGGIFQELSGHRE